MPLRLRLLGTPAVERGGAGRPLRLDRPASLLVHLAVRGTWTGRAELAFLYRPDEPEARGLAYVRQLLFRARRLDWAVGLEIDEAGARWVVDSDLGSFRAAVASGAFDAALDAYGGPFLHGAELAGAPGFATWQELQREELERAWRRAALRVAMDAGAAGDATRAVRLLEELARHDPLDEEVVTALVRNLAAQGRRREAFEVYERFRSTLERELGVPPLEATRALAHGLLAVEAAPAAARPGASLPSPTPPFVGREREVERVVRLLGDDEVRLVTLVGLGGSGKTRLALEAARRAGDAFADGAAFVALGAVTSPERVLPAVREALDVRGTNDDAEAALVSGLREKELLLVLDEFEGVVEAAPALARLLGSLPRVTVLVTSREALEVRGEWLVDVEGLDVPPEEATRDLEAYEAVRLFVGRAARVAPAFVPTRPALRAIAAICRRLEGLPLAIELAAAWTRATGPEALLEELERDALGLATTLRDVPERHRSLWAVVDYAVRRLDPAAREALVRLTPFRGPFDLDAARRVAGTGLEALTALLNRSLLRRGEHGRYAMHALVREYALADGPPADAEAAHARHYADLLVRLGPDLTGRDPVTAVARIHAERADVEAAWEYAVRAADVALLDACRDALDHYLHYRSRWTVAAAAFRRAADATARVEGPEARRVRARLLLHRSQYERSLGRLADARAGAREALDLLTGAGRPHDAAHAQLQLALVAHAASEPDAAAAGFAATLGAALALGDRYLEAAARNGIANVLCTTDGDLAAAERHYRASLAAHADVGNLEGVNGALINLGACRYDRGDPDEAARLWREAIEIVRRLGHVQREAVLHANLGALAEDAGDHAEALDRYGRSLALREEVGDRPGRAKVLHDLGRLALAAGRPEEARGRLQEALDLHVEPDERAATSHVRATLARTLARLGRLAEADAHARAALALAHEADARHDMLIALLVRAELRERQGRAEEALRLAGCVAREAAGSLEPVRRAAEEVVARAGAGLPARRADALLRALPSGAARAIAAAELGPGT